MPLEPVDRRSLTDEVHRQLLDGILAGEFPVDSPLPSERALVEQLAVNRQAVREALQRLSEAGLIETVHGGRSRVRDWRRHAGLPLLPHLLFRHDGSIDPAVARSIMEMRAVVAPDAARLCALRAPAGLAERLRGVVDAMSAVAGDTGALSPLDWRFWEIVIDGADNVAYLLAINALRDADRLLGDLIPVVLADELRDIEGKAAITEAIAAGEPEAAFAAARRVIARGLETTALLLTTTTDLESLR